ncbi:G1/S-specific cyclin-E1-like [Daphnia pulicaria]|uniref:G1/S-specific cyclin-E1-like n=1 Tax=Daphnia pulicaria TaxID=35523 RepID=UPI001EEB32E2|nr:G1/S-specific cyclin-E1-like [Daphnia pulicaria]XP_046637608.1 G1/S-specific cyclin-E1-like [Daphnia pulicaria]XP_046637609.1 G1/S-specific cyclin-E1-like [Daphnia pulicaria]
MSRRGCRVTNKRESLPGQKLLPVILNRKRKSETHVQDYENDVRDMRARQPYHQQQAWEENVGWETSSQSSSVSNSTSDFRRLAVSSQILTSRLSPFPKFNWADPDEVWNSLCRKDRLYKRNHDYILAHPSLQPRMRAILLDWLVEVCEVYRLHRETYHLALDFVDRYLATQTDIPKQQLQLIGIAALFIAAKIEEIYPPKLNEFAYVTDGACSEAEIMMKELVIMKSLNWELSPATANCWLGIYMQLANALGDKEELESKENSGSKMETKQFSSHTFVQAARLLDLSTMDILSLRYTYSAIAAAAVYHIVGERVALQCSGYSWEEISSCIYWMAPFALTLREAGPVEIKTFSQIPIEDTHNIQTHNIDLSILEAAQSRLTESAASPPSPALGPLGMLTPPQSKNKGRTSAPLSPVNNNTTANAVVLTPSTLNSESPRCSTITSEWNDDAQSAISYS